MISSNTSCSQLVAGNYDVLVDDDEEDDDDEPNNSRRLEDEGGGEAADDDTNKNLMDDRLESDQDIKSVLIEYLKKFEAYESELLLDTNNFNYNCKYANEFKMLKRLSKELKENRANLLQGEEEFNDKKNRYKDIIPFEHTRVVLRQVAKFEPGSDYINANFIKGPSGNERAYIACQGPLACTLNDFWRMIWECQVSIVVMACNEFESGKPKCELYWPNEIQSSHLYGNIQVTLVRVRQICADFLIRKFSIKVLEDLGEDEQQQQQQEVDQSDRSHDQRQQQTRRVLAERTICQFHYTTWPDHGAPDSVQAILELVKLVRDIQADDDRPILIHCSAGCGRTGTICCIDYVWGLLRNRKLNSANSSLFNIINEMRQQRMAMVQTLEQYILCHRAVAALYINHLKHMNSLDEINNVLLIAQESLLIYSNASNNNNYNNKEPYHCYKTNKIDHESLHSSSNGNDGGVNGNRGDQKRDTYDDQEEFLEPVFI